jgi:hypothetical protein
MIKNVQKTKMTDSSTKLLRNITQGHMSIWEEYQIAIEFKKRHANEFAAIGKPVGEKNTGEHTSLAQYIANELSRRIKSDNRYPIEGSFLHRAHLSNLSYDDEG